MPGVKIARLLGWFSIGLGIVETVAPGALGRFLGLENKRGLLRAYGLREMGAGVGLLAGGPRSVQWLWGRVAGDALDVATLYPALKQGNLQRQKARVALLAVVGITLLDLIESLWFSSARRARRLIGNNMAPEVSSN
jgi:hypothetical protein